MIPLLQMASLGGVTLVTLWLLLLNVLLWRALSGGARARAAAGAVFMLALPWAWGLKVLGTAPRESGAAVGLIQGDIAGDIKWSGNHQLEILSSFLDLSQRAVGRTPAPSLLIWPETAT